MCLRVFQIGAIEFCLDKELSFCSMSFRFERAPYAASGLNVCLGDVCACFAARSHDSFSLFHDDLVMQEISRLRYQLCPRVMKERRFWRIYFTLVSTHVAP